MGRSTSSLLLVAVLLACGDQVAYEPNAAQSEPAGNRAGTTDAAASAEATLVRISPQEAFELLQDPPAGLVVLDVRTAGEFAAGHLEGALQLDFYSDDFETRVAALDRAVPYLLYCQSGGRSGSTLNTMRALGFQRVYEIDGGYGAWSSSGLPFVQ